MAGGFVDVTHAEAPMTSGGIDARSFFDGSGWTVSTGASKAVGGARTQSGSEPYSFGQVAEQPLISAGYGAGMDSTTMTLLAAGALVLAIVFTKKKS